MSKILIFIAFVALLPFLCHSFSSENPTDRRILVLLDDFAIKSSHSIFFKSLQTRGFELDFKLADDPKITLQRYGQYLYDGLIIFSPSIERFGGNLDLTAVLNFVDSDHDLIVAADTSASDLIRDIATECADIGHLIALTYCGIRGFFSSSRSQVSTPFSIETRKNHANWDFWVFRATLSINELKPSKGFEQKRRSPWNCLFCELGKMVALVSRTGRHLQRYNMGRRLVVGCIPYRYKYGVQPTSDKGVPHNEVEVLVISSQKGKGMLFPKGGWEIDESMKDAALRETLEEAGVLGNVECKLGEWNFKSKSHDTVYEGHMFSLLVKEELDLWPEKNLRQRKWMTVAEAREACLYGWMKEALDELVCHLDCLPQEEEEEVSPCSLS